MPNYVPYIALIVLSLAVLIGIFIRTRRFRTFVVYMTFAGMIYVFEIVVVVILDAYEYEPRFTSIKYVDNMIGAAVSNTFTIPSIAALISLYRLRFRWIALFAIGFGGVEALFMYLGVYVHHWWRVIYTIASLFFYFSLTKWWFGKFLAGSRPIRAVSSYVYTMALVLTFMLSLILFGLRRFELGLFSDNYRDDIFFSSLYGAAEALMIAAAIFWLRNWRWLIATAILVIVSQYAMIRSDVLRVFVPMPLYVLIYFACCCLVIWLCYLARRSVEAM
ncbi:MAG: hypothetical protein J7559_20395 [Cohnella sp.]|nr:hypothetical protein [Cohnella sp.]